MKSNYKQRMKEEQSRKKGELIDIGIGIGLTLASVALNESFGFGRDRLFKFNKASLLKLKDEFKRGAEKNTQEYEDNVDVAMVHLNRDYKRLLGEENIKKLKYLDEE